MQVLTLMRSRHYPFRVEGGARSSALFVPSAIIASRLLLDGSYLNLATKVRPCSSSARRSSMNLTTQHQGPPAAAAAGGRGGAGRCFFMMARVHVIYAIVVIVRIELMIHWRTNTTQKSHPPTAMRSHSFWQAGRGRDHGRCHT